MADALSRTVRLLESLGHQVEEAEVDLGGGWEEFVLANARLMAANLTAMVGWIDRLLDRSPFTAAFNVAGTPAMSVPLTADTETGLPIGMQIAAGYGREGRLFRLAGQLEQASPWSRRTPSVWAGNAPGR